MHIDAGLYICVHVLIQDTNNTLPTLFPVENISMIDAFLKLWSRCQLWELPSKASDINHLYSKQAALWMIKCSFFFLSDVIKQAKKS